MKYKVVHLEGDGRSPFPLWDVRDSQTEEPVRDGVYATEESANSRAERENQSVTPAA